MSRDQLAVSPCRCCIIQIALRADAAVSSDLSFDKQLAAALGAAGVPVEGAEQSVAAVEGTAAGIPTEEGAAPAAVAAAKASGKERKKSGGVFGYLFGGGGARDEEAEAEEEAASVDGECACVRTGPTIDREDEAAIFMQQSAKPAPRHWVDACCVLFFEGEEGGVSKTPAQRTFDVLNCGVGVFFLGGGRGFRDSRPRVVSPFGVFSRGVGVHPMRAAGRCNFASTRDETKHAHRLDQLH